MKIYISGPITGRAYEEVERAFAEAEAAIRERGDEPVNPLENGLSRSATWHEHMRADLRMLLDCDAIYLVGEWRRSRGAVIEQNMAAELGMKILPGDDDDEWDLYH